MFLGTDVHIIYVQNMLSKGSLYMLQRRTHPLPPAMVMVCTPPYGSVVAVGGCD